MIELWRWAWIKGTGVYSLSKEYRTATYRSEPSQLVRSWSKHHQHTSEKINSQHFCVVLGNRLTFELLPNMAKKAKKPFQASLLANVLQPHRSSPKPDWHSQSDLPLACRDETEDRWIMYDGSTLRYKT